MNARVPSVTPISPTNKGALKRTDLFKEAMQDVRGMARSRIREKSAAKLSKEKPQYDLPCPTEEFLSETQLKVVDYENYLGLSKAKFIGASKSLAVTSDLPVERIPPRRSLRWLNDEHVGSDADDITIGSSSHRSRDSIRNLNPPTSVSLPSVAFRSVKEQMADHKGGASVNNVRKRTLQKHLEEITLSRPNTAASTTSTDRDDRELSSMHPLTKGKYFGTEAKLKFYETYRELGRQSHLFVGGIDELDASIRNEPGSHSFVTAVHELVDLSVITPRFSRPNTGNNIFHNNDHRMEPLPSLLQESGFEGFDVLESPSMLVDLDSMASWGLPLGTTSSEIISPSTNVIHITRSGNDNNNIHDATPISSRGPSRPGSRQGLKKLDLSSSLATMSIHEQNNELETHIATYEPNSPRATFLAGCLKNNIPPRTAALIRDQLTSTINLTHIGLGDTLAQLLASAIAGMPLLERLILRDNQLHDPGLKAILDAIAAHDHITELDISSNKIDEKAAEALANLISSPTCSLLILRLCQADIDDGECASFIGHLMQNHRLQELDMSKNLLGRDENLNVVMPSFETGAEAIATMISEGSCPIHTLNLHWNMIRLDGAVTLMDSLRHAQHLTSLDISFNAIGRNGAVTLGSSLLDNEHLVELILTNNNIDEIGWFTIAVGARENKSIRYIELDGNPLGETGGRMLCKVARFHGQKVKFSVAKCDLSIRCPDAIINLTELSQSYALDLSNPYHRAVAYELLDAIALDPQLKFQTFEYSHDNGKSDKFKSVDIKLERLPNETLDEQEQQELKMLKTIVAVAFDIDKITNMFEKFDRDKSGELDVQEFRAMTKSLGVHLSKEKAAAIVASVDAAGGNSIELDETIEYLVHLGTTSQGRIKQLESYPLFCHKGTRTRYLPPNHGFLRITVQECLVFDDTFGCITQKQLKLATELIETALNPAQVLRYIVEANIFYLDEAQYMCNLMRRYESQEVFILARILPRMAAPIDTKSLIKTYVSSTAMNKHLKQTMGKSFAPLLGLFSGFYSLDMVKGSDRTCLARLFQRNALITGHRKSEKLGDTSQNGNWISFRNVMMNGHPLLALNPSDFSPMPKQGRIEFDFADVLRPNPATDRPMRDIRVFKTLMTAGLVLGEHEQQLVSKRLAQYNIETRKYLSCGGYGNFGQSNSMSKMIAVYDHLHTMHSLFEKKERQEVFNNILKKEMYVKKEDEDDTMDHSQSSRLITSIPPGSVGSAAGSAGGGTAGTGTSPGGGARFRKTMDISAQDLKGMKERNATQRITEEDDGVADEDDISVLSEMSNKIASLPATPAPLLRMHGVSKNLSIVSKGVDKVKQAQLAQRQANMALKKDHNNHAVGSNHSPKNLITGLLKQENDEASSPSKAAMEFRRFTAALQDPEATPEYKASILLDFFVSTLSTRWLLCKQLAVLLSFYQVGITRKSHHGSYRVELIITLFFRILDIQHFDFILNELNAEEHAALLARLGWLNIFNPSKASGCYKLDLSRWEERQVAKMLMHLSVSEPGESWHEEMYFFSGRHDCMPGWTLNTVWYSPEGFPSDGTLQLRFSSGDGVLNHDCRPNRYIRYMMHRLVLCDWCELKQDATFLHFWTAPERESVDINALDLEECDDEDEEEPGEGDIVGKREAALDKQRREEVEARLTAQLFPSLKTSMDTLLMKYLGVVDIHEHLRDKTAITWDYSNMVPSDHIQPLT